MTASPDQNGNELAESLLTPELLELFSKMQPSEKAHSLEIAGQLLDQGETHPELLAAALLHDLGKIKVPLSIFERVEIVLGRFFFPRSASQWGKSGEVQGWKRAFVVGEQHAAWGADLAAEAGASEMTVALIRRHQEIYNPDPKKEPGSQAATLENDLLYKLQALDREN